MALVREVYILTRALPKEEMYGLASQRRRAAVSIPSNIAEGNGRNTTKDYSHFLGIAMGSHAELETLVELVPTLYPEISVEEIREDVHRVGGLLWKLRESIKAKI